MTAHANRFAVGDRVRNATSGEGVIIRNSAATDGVLDGDGDVRVRFDNGGERWVDADLVDHVEAPTIGTAAVRVQVRFFVGDTDVTDLLKEALS